MSDEYIPSLMADLEEISSYDDIVEKTDDMEGCFLRVKAARQWWHGAAYGKLETNEEKKMYRERYGLKAGSINDWASATTKITENRDLSTLAQDPALNFSHAQAIAPLVKDHPEDAERLLQDAIDNELTATAINFSHTQEQLCQRNKVLEERNDLPLLMSGLRMMSERISVRILLRG